MYPANYELPEKLGGGGGGLILSYTVIKICKNEFLFNVQRN